MKNTFAQKILAFALVLATLQAQAQVGNAGTTDPALTTVSVNDEGEKLLADTRGNTLYVFDLDQNSNAPKCNEACAEVWPPYLLTEAEVANLAAPLGSVARANKKTQLTYEGRPVYTYAFDRGLSADAGDGIGGVWHYIEILK